MSAEQTIEARHQAYIALINCSWYRANRDQIIRRAAALGIPKTEIAQILRMNRGHVSDIANTKPGDPQRTSEVEGAAQHPKDDT